MVNISDEDKYLILNSLTYEEYMNSIKEIENSLAKYIALYNESIYDDIKLDYQSLYFKN